MSPPPRVPRTLPLPSGATIRSLPLSASEGFVLSRVDGVMTEPEISALTGLSALQTAETLDKLAGLRLVTFEPAPARPERRAVPASASSVSSVPPRPVSEATGLRRPPTGDVRVDAAQPARALYDPADLDEEADLDPQRKRTVLDLFYRLDETDHYALLGVARDADKKAIKRAYYALASEYHPDRFFGKRLGSFKQKIESIFGRMTSAHDALTRKDTREEYDRFLGDREASARFEQSLREPSLPPTATMPEVPLFFEPAVPVAPVAPTPASERARRDALARKLLGSRAQQAVPPPKPVVVPTTDRDALKRLYDEKTKGVRERAIQSRIALAEQALERDDASAATTAVRAALSAMDDQHALRPHALALEARANRSQGENYRRQGAYQEKMAQWKDASKSWIKAAQLLPDDAEANERAANAVLKAGGNLHEAAQFAQRAVALAAENTPYKLTLAQVYMAAGLTLNARRQLEAVLEASPSDPVAAALLKRANTTEK